MTLVWDANVCVVCTKPLEKEGSPNGRYFPRSVSLDFASDEVLLPDNNYARTCAECNPALRCSWWNPECNCLWSCIPDTVMERVFCFLDVRDLAKASVVSRRWSFLCQQTSLYKTVDMSSVGRSHQWGGRTRESEGLISIVKRHGHSALSTIKLCGLQRLTPECLGYLGHAAVNLRELHFCNILTLTDDALISIFRNCKRLQNLQLPGCHVVSDQALGEAHQTSISVLNLSRCKFSAEGLRAMLRSDARVARSLRCLNLSNCPNLDEEAVALVAGNAGALRELSLAGLELGGGTLRAVARGCPELEVLDVSADSFMGNDSISDGDVAELTRLKRLRRLELGNLTALTDAGVERLLTSLPALRILNLAGCQSLEFGAKLHERLGRTPLHGLTLASTEATPATLETLSRSPLRTLDVNGCERLTPVVVDYLEAGFKDLRKVDIALCQIGEAHIERLRASRPELEVVHY